MATYSVKLMNKAVEDLDGIYDYIAAHLREPGTALNLVNRIEEGILSLEEMPYRCPERKVGIFANNGYRQLFVGNYTIVFRIQEQEKLVIIVTIRYSPSQF